MRRLPGAPKASPATTATCARSSNCFARVCRVRREPGAAEVFGHVRKDVKRSLRSRAGNAGYFAHAGQYPFSPPRVLRKHLRYRVHWASQRGNGRLLRKRIRVRNGLALQLRHRGDHRFWSKRESCAPARHREVFEREPATITCGSHGCGCDRVRLHAAIEEVRIAFIASSQMFLRRHTSRMRWYSSLGSTAPWDCSAN